MIETSFLKLARICIVGLSLLSIAICSTLVGISASLVAYRFSWDTWHGLWQSAVPADVPVSQRSFKYLPPTLWMSPIYLSLAVGCIGLFLAFAMAFVNLRHDLHSRIVKHTFERLPSTLVPALLLMVLALAATVVSFTLNHKSYPFTPYIAPDAGGYYRWGGFTLDNYQCQISPYAEHEWQRSRTKLACRMGIAMRSLDMTLLFMCYIILVCTLLSVKANRKARATTRVKTESMASTIAPSGWAQDEHEQFATHQSPVSPIDVYARERRQFEPEIEKLGHEILEKDGWHRVELPADNQPVALETHGPQDKL